MADAKDAPLAATMTLKFSDADALAEALRTYSGDQGSGGLCIQVIKYYELADRVHMTLECGEDAPMEIHGLVAWRKPGYIGVRFDPRSATENKVFASLKRLMGEAAAKAGGTAPPVIQGTKPFAE